MQIKSDQPETRVPGIIRTGVLLHILLFPHLIFAQISFERTYGGLDYEEGFSVQQTSDGGYIIAGTTESFGAGIRDVYLIKTDSYGDTLWTKTYCGSEWDLGRSVQQTSDGGYIIAGVTESFGAGLEDVYLIKTCPDGSVGPCKKNCLTFDDLDETIADADIDNEGVRRSLQAKANNARRQFDRGNLKASGNVLCASFMK